MSNRVEPPLGWAKAKQNHTKRSRFVTFVGGVFLAFIGFLFTIVLVML